MECHDHALSCEQWAALLLAVDTVEYSDSPPPQGPAVALTTEARVEVYRQRAAMRRGHRTADSVSLYHPGDSWRNDAAGRAGVEAGRGPNGAVFGREVRHG